MTTTDQTTEQAPRGMLAPQQPPDAAVPQAPPQERAMLASEMPPGEDGREEFTTRLKPKDAAWIRARAEAHGEEVDRHIATILMTFKAQHDEWAREQAAGTARPGRQAR